MWNKKRSQFILVRISLGGLRRLVIPIPLFVLDITLSATADLALLGDLFAPVWRRELRKHLYPSSCLNGRTVSLISLRSIFGVCLQFFDELRNYGRWRMVEVKTGKVEIFVDFY